MGQVRADGWVPIALPLSTAPRKSEMLHETDGLFGSFDTLHVFPKQ